VKVGEGEEDSAEVPLLSLEGEGDMAGDEAAKGGEHPVEDPTRSRVRRRRLRIGEERVRERVGMRGGGGVGGEEEEEEEEE
jgi:hypothetical protein